MTKYILLLLFITFSFISFAQNEYKPTKIGIVKEFIGKVDRAYQYDYDAIFSINDVQLGRVVSFYLQNGCCCLGDDKYALPIKISDELYAKILSEDEWKNLKIKVTAKSSYVIECSGNNSNKKVIAWRPTVVTLVN